LCHAGGSAADSGLFAKKLSSGLAGGVRDGLLSANPGIIAGRRVGAEVAVCFR